MRKCLLTILFFMMMVSTAFAQEIRLNINDDFVDPIVVPVQEKGTTLVPIRVVSENLGASVKWDRVTQSITIVQGTTEIKLQIGDRKVWVNGNMEELAIAPRLIKGTTMVPIRFISENLGCDVYWQSKNRVISITSKTREKRDPIPINQTQRDIVFIENENFDKLLIEDYGFSIEIPHLWRGYFTIEEGNWAHNSARTIDFTFIYDNMEISNIFSIIMLEKSDEIDEDYASEMWNYLATEEGIIYTSSQLMEPPTIFDTGRYDNALEILTKMVNEDYPKILKTFKNLDY